MKKSTQKVLSVLLTMLMLLTAIPLTGFATGTPAEEVEGRAKRLLDYFDYVLNKDELEITVIEDDPDTPEDETLSLTAGSVEGFIESIKDAIDNGKFGGSIDNVDTTALDGLTRSDGDANFLYALVDFIGDNADMAEDFLTGELDFGIFDALLPEEITHLDVYGMLMSLIKEVADGESPRALEADSIDAFLFSLAKMAVYELGDALGMTETRKEELIANADLENSNFYDILNNLVDGIYDGAFAGEAGLLTVPVRSVFSFLTDTQVDTLDKITPIYKGEVYEAVKAVYEARYNFGDCATITVDGQKYYGYYFNGAVQFVAVDSATDLNKDTFIAGYTDATRGEAVYNSVLQLLGAVNPDFVFNPDMLDIKGNCDTYGGILEQLNHMIYVAADILLSEQAKTAVGWVDGDNSLLNENLRKAVQYVMPLIADIFSAEGEELFDSEIFDAEYYDADFTLESFACDVIREIVDTYYADYEPEEGEPDFRNVFPEDASSLDSLFAITLNTVFGVLFTEDNLDFGIEFDFSDKIYTDETKTAVKPLTDKEWDELIMEELVFVLQELLVYVNFPCSLSREEVDRYRSEGWGYKEFLDEIFDGVYTYFLEGIIVPDYELTCERGVYDGNGAWYKLSALLDTVLPLGLLNNCEKTYGDETLPFDIGVLIEDRILGDVLDLDVDGVLSILYTNTDGANLFYGNNLDRALLLTVQKLINGIAPGTVQTEDIASFDTLVSNETLGKMAKRMIKSLVNRKEQLVNIVFSWLDLFGIIDELPIVSGDYVITTNGSWFNDDADKNTATISDYLGGAADTLVIPETIAGYTVTAIGYDAFYGVQASQIVLPSTLKRIEERAFSNCPITSVVIPEDVTEIGYGAFQYCYSLSSVTLPSTLKYIRGNAFYDDYSLTTVNGDPSFTSIESGAFSGTGLKDACETAGLDAVYIGNALIDFIPKNILSADYDYNGILEIPEGIEIIASGALGRKGYYYDYGYTYYDYIKAVRLPSTVIDQKNDPYNTFSSDSGTMAFEVSEDNPDYCAQDGVLYSKDMKTLICYPSGKEDTEYTIPDSVTGIKISINNSNLQTINIGSGMRNNPVGTCSSLQQINVSAENRTYSSVNGLLLSKDGKTLYECPKSIPVSNLVIPEGVETIYQSDFYGVHTVTELTLPASLVSWQGYGAYYTLPSLQSYTVAPGNTKYCSVDGVLFNAEKTTLVAFPRNYGTTSYTVPEGVVSIASCAFFDSNLRSVTLPDTLISIGSDAFSSTQLESVEIPDSVVSMEYGAFRSSGLRSVTFGSGLTEIPNSAFYYCNLTSVTLPDGITKVGENAFYGNHSLSNVVLNNNLSYIGYDAFGNCGFITLFVPASVTEIGYNAFGDSYNSTVVILGVPGSYAETYARNNGYNFCSYDGTGISLNAPKETSESTITVYGNATPGAEVTITVSNSNYGTYSYQVTADRFTKFRTQISLPGSYDYSPRTYTLVAKVTTEADGEATTLVSKPVQVNYNPRTFSFKSMVFSHHYSSVEFTSENVGANTPYVTYVPAKASSFVVDVTNSNDISSVYVLSSITNGMIKTTKKIELRRNEIDGKWYGTGAFGDSNYVPGVLSIRVIDRYGNVHNLEEKFYCRFLIDPSGFVYEAVQSNRVEGATAAVYYKPFDAAEEDEGILWEEAEATGQVNPQTTGKDGVFSWVVPEGLWQVRVTKDDYEMAKSDWMRIPPEVTDLAIPLFTTLAPTVESVQLYENTAEIYFSQYMKIDTVKDAISFEGCEGEIEAIDAEISGFDKEEDQVYFATAFTFTLTEGDFAGGAELTIADTAENYAGIKMAEAYKRSFESTVAHPDTLTAEIEDASLLLNGDGTINISANNAAGLKVSVEAENDYVVGLSDTELTLNEEGKASLSVNAKNVGTVELTFKLNNTALSAKVTLTVGMGVHEHTFEEENYRTVQPSTCLEEGYEICQCGTCGVFDVRDLPLADHKTVTVEAHDGTCCVKGHKAYSYCSVCLKLLTVGGEDVSAQNYHKQYDAAVYELGLGDHSFVNYKTNNDATCEKDGTMTAKCEYCDAKDTVTDEGTAFGHSWDDGTVITAPTCSKEGVMTFTCRRDKNHTKTEAISTVAHTPKTVPGKAATCKEAGLTEGTICEVCKTVLTEQKPIEMLAHTPKTVPGKAASCTETGLTDGKVCAECGKELEAQKTIPVIAHADNNGDGYCDSCSADLGTHPQEDTGFFAKLMAFIQRIIDFFKNLFNF